MRLSYGEIQAKEHALKYEIAQQRGFLSLGVATVVVARDLVNLSEELGREVGTDLDWILRSFAHHPEAEQHPDKTWQVTFMARSLAKLRAGCLRQNVTFV
jgi:hypothetical protein